MPIRIMLVDDSEVIRFLYTKALERDTELQVVSSVSNAFAAIEMAKLHQPDIILLDIEMPKMSGLTAIPLLLAEAPNSKIIVVSALGRQASTYAVEALEKRASDCVLKPGASGALTPEVFHAELRQKIKSLYNIKATQPTISQTIAPPRHYPRLRTRPIEAIAIASSTGGPAALITLFEGLKNRIPSVPIFITQHMPAEMTAVLAKHISEAANTECQEASHGGIVRAHHIYVAPGNYHLTARRYDTQIFTQLDQSEPVNSCRPSADPMFTSLSEVYGEGLLVIVLTGIGYDGAEGARFTASRGGMVIAQGEASAIAYGMPRATASLGICNAILPLANIAPYLLEKCQFKSI